MLLPGTGADVYSSVHFTTTIVSWVLNHDGSPFQGDGPLIFPPVFNGPDGVYLLGDKMPTRDIGLDIFLNLLGRPPNIGEQVRELSGISTYLGNDTWDSIPTLQPGSSAFLTVKSVPEHSTLATMLLGLAGLLRLRRKN